MFRSRLSKSEIRFFKICWPEETIGKEKVQRTASTVSKSLTSNIEQEKVYFSA